MKVIIKKKALGLRNRNLKSRQQSSLQLKAPLSITKRSIIMVHSTNHMRPFGMSLQVTLFSIKHRVTSFHNPLYMLPKMPQSQSQYSVSLIFLLKSHHIHQKPITTNFMFILQITCLSSINRSLSVKGNIRI